ncbi:hypothetical protein BKP45_08055 [Anaerobacillus alkalidiazotrophicus]|uniref:Uncharacterized protein n=1 Tax=Anaerobacillus alkalidiazotrophicus TaxID=472963 RepID=A0A1S2M8B3_9BACI|nr:hypothetical protein [Anaerobacillus alkalidiazotrophicus]OIJ20743.1 hypothetical protein BKP45_08055 [Anaerobacillus alkalidiazotrophicus]
MDFQRIDQNVMKYLDKQKKSLQLNPRGINLTIKKLDQYASNFHFEINELLKLENKSTNNDIEKKIQKPKIKFVDVERFDDVEKVKSKLVSVSNKLINELNILIKNSRGFHLEIGNGSTKRFRRNVDYILREELDVSYTNKSHLYRVVSAINQEIRYGYCENFDELNKLFQYIRDPRVIDELKGSSEENIFSIIDDMFRQYKDYFSQCIVSYITYYNHMPEIAQKDEEHEVIKTKSERMIAVANSPTVAREERGSKESKASEQIAKQSKFSDEVKPSIQGNNSEKVHASLSTELDEREILSSQRKPSEGVAVRPATDKTETVPHNADTQTSEPSTSDTNRPTEISQLEDKPNSHSQTSVLEEIRAEDSKDESESKVITHTESETIISENEKAYLESKTTKPKQKTIETISIRYSNGETRELTFAQIDQKLNLQLEVLFEDIEQLTEKIKQIK